MITAQQTQDVLAMTDKMKTSGTFFFTADAETIQIMPDHKYDRRIIDIY